MNSGEFFQEFDFCWKTNGRNDHLCGVMIRVMMEEEGSFSSSSSFSSNVRSVLSEQNARDDLTAPATIRLAAQEPRGLIIADNADGLTIHRFHIKKRENPKKKQIFFLTANQHACWCAVCDVCGDDREHTIEASTSSHHALYTFSKDHLKGKRHLDRGTQIIAANALVSSTAGLDDSAYAAPVHRGSKMTVAEKKRNEQLQKEKRQEEEQQLKRPRLDNSKPGNRSGTRAAGRVGGGGGGGSGGK